MNVTKPLNTSKSNILYVVDKDYVGPT